MSASNKPSTADSQGAALPRELSGEAQLGATVITATDESVGARIGRYRWVICALIFFATTINYADRQVLGILAPDLQRTFGWSEIEYGRIVLAFQASYAAGLLIVGGLIDRFGTRIGYALSLTAWSIAAMAHALARTSFGFGAARAALGLSESGNFPAAIKTVAEWFPKKERAFATGFVNAGTNVGAIVAPLTVPWITIRFGWQWAFIATGAVGFLWLAFWLPLYRRPQEQRRLSKSELAHIESDPPDSVSKIRWTRLASHRQTWAIALGKFLTDPIWWFYLYWLAKFLDKNYGITLSQVGLPLVTVYFIADLGSVGGGWLSSTLIKRGWTVNAGRKTAMLICAVAVVPVVFASKASNLWVAVILIGIATASHQGFSANLFTMASDMFPRRAVGSVVGIGGMAGAVGGMLFAELTGQILQWTGSYVPIFIICGLAYLVSLSIVHLLAPTLEGADLATDR